MDFKVGDLYLTEENGKKEIWECMKIIPEPQVRFLRLPDNFDVVLPFSEAEAIYRHMTVDPRPAHRPKGSKSKKINCFEAMKRNMPEVDYALSIDVPRDGQPLYKLTMNGLEVETNTLRDGLELLMKRLGVSRETIEGLSESHNRKVILNILDGGEVPGPAGEEKDG